MVRKIACQTYLLAIFILATNNSFAMRKKKRLRKKTSLHKKISLKNMEAKAFVAIKEGNTELLEIFLKSGVKINTVVEENGSTLLHKAASLGKKNMVELLIQYNADITAKDNFDLTPIQNAEKTGNNKIAEYLKEELSKIENKKFLKRAKRIALKKTKKNTLKRIISLLTNVCTTEENYF